MNSDNFKVNLSLRDAMSKLDDGIIRESVTGGGSVQGMFLKFDWGVSKSFISLPRDIFRMDII